MIETEQHNDLIDAAAGEGATIEDYEAESLKELGMYDTQDEGSDVPSHEADPADETTSGTTSESSAKKEKPRVKSRMHGLSLRAIQAEQKAAQLEEQLREANEARQRAEATAKLKASQGFAQPDEFDSANPYGEDYGYSQETSRRSARAYSDEDIDNIVEAKLRKAREHDERERKIAEAERSVQSDIRNSMRATLSRVPNQEIVPDILDEIELSIVEGKMNKNIAHLLVGMKDLQYAAAVLHTLRKRSDFETLPYPKLLALASRLNSDYMAPKSRRSKAAVPATHLGTATKKEKPASSYEEFLRDQNEKQKARRRT